MTHDNAHDALEYAAKLLEKQDAGGTLPGTLRQIANTYDDLLAACVALISVLDQISPDTSMSQLEIQQANEALEQANAAIAAARGDY